MTMEQLATIVGTIGGVNILTIISVIIAFLTYRHKVKKDAEDKAKSEGKLIEKLDNMDEKLDRLEKHDEAELKARQEMAISIARLETKVDAHITNKAIHMYNKGAAAAKGVRKQ